MMVPYTLSRRDFLTTSTAAALAATPLLSPLARAASSNDRLRVGVIGCGSRGHSLLNYACQLQSEQNLLEVAAVCDVFNARLASGANVVGTKTGQVPRTCVDYRELLADDSIDAVIIATPDHWHARQALDALAAGKHVYCEKPMTRTIDEAVAVLHAWQASDRVMQVGVHSTSIPVWHVANEWIRTGRLGKIMQYQTEFYRNSAIGQWRDYAMTPDMTPANIDWPRFLGLEFGLAEDRPFDREAYAQWRCFWDFGSGMFSDLFVHRTTTMLLATGLRFPGRVVGAGGIFLEYDGRQVPDVGTIVSDFSEGVQGLVTATMCSAETPLRQLIRGHHGSAVFGNGEDFTGFDFVAERPQVTGDSAIEDERVETGEVTDATVAHLQNFVAAVASGQKDAVHCSPELGAAAIVNVRLGARSYREGKVFHFDRENMRVVDGDASWSQQWEQRSRERGQPSHVSGWTGGAQGSTLATPPDDALRGPWIDGADPLTRLGGGG